MSKRRFNPLVIDPEDYGKLFDEAFLGEDDEVDNTDEYEDLSDGCRRKKPSFETEL